METRLHGWHVANGARMVDFGGWDMPVQYETGPREEHMRVREAAGLFDIDHMGRLEISGPHAVEFLQRVQTWDISLLKPGRAHYSMILNDSGGILDDIFVYHRTDSWLVVVNASNAPKDTLWLTSHASGLDVSIRDLRAETCMAALQGPAARGVLQALGPKEDLESIGYHHVVERTFAGARVTLCTTGYTGEPGYEILMPAQGCEKLWNAILEAGAPRRLIPCGLAARDSLRAEACLPLYGNEIDETTDPLSGGLVRAAVRLEGHDFIGRRALAALALSPLPSVLVGFEMKEPGVPRHGYSIASGGRVVGKVTTGLFSPSTGKYVGMGYVETGLAGVDTEVSIVIRDAHKAAQVVERPFYTSPNWR
jgi:aminomethyltransferase